MTKQQNFEPLPKEEPLVEPPTADPEALLRTLVKVVSALKKQKIPFALAGGTAVYARGGPASDHDIDILVTEENARRAVQALIDNGMRGAQPPEDWLLKAYDGDRLIDFIFRPNNRQVTVEELASAEELPVGSVMIPVLKATDIVIDKLLVLGPHRCDFSALLPIVRALREQIDWSVVQEKTAQSPYAESFLLLAQRLSIVPSLAVARGKRGNQNGWSTTSAI